MKPDGLILLLFQNGTTWIHPRDHSLNHMQSQASDRRDDVVTVSDAEQTVSNDAYAWV